MNYKNKPIAIGVAAVVGAGVLLAWHQHRTGPAAADQQRTHAGVVNPDKVVAGLTSRSAPELSTQRFEPPPSMGVGSYTDPAVAKSAASKETPKKDSKPR